MTMAAARCLILSPICCRSGRPPSSSSALRLPRITRPPLSSCSCSCSCSASPLAAVGSMDAPPQGYRTNVGICLANPSLTKIFSASRIDIPSAWQMPQGGIDEGEDPRAAAVRELREETGVTSAEIVSEAPNWLTYDFPPDAREKLNARWGTDWKGQAQKWDKNSIGSFLWRGWVGKSEEPLYRVMDRSFLFRFTGKDDEINLDGDGSEKPEFSEWAWMTPQQVIEKAVDFKKPVYEEALKHFAPYLQSDPTASS